MALAQTALALSSHRGRSGAGSALRTLHPASANSAAPKAPSAILFRWLRLCSGHRSVTDFHGLDHARVPQAGKLPFGPLPLGPIELRLCLRAESTSLGRTRLHRP